jgi:hypothetical protein
MGTEKTTRKNKEQEKARKGGQEKARKGTGTDCHPGQTRKGTGTDCHPVTLCGFNT